MKIYIPATYRDLHKHCQAVAGILAGWAIKRLGMEDYAAEGMRPLNHCLADVASCDVYVGMVYVAVWLR